MISSFSTIRNVGEDKSSSSVPPCHLSAASSFGAICCFLCFPSDPTDCVCATNMCEQNKTLLFPQRMPFYSCTGAQISFPRAVHSVLWISKGEYYTSSCGKFSPLKICSSHQTSASRPDAELHRVARTPAVALKQVLEIKAPSRVARAHNGRPCFLISAEGRGPLPSLTPRRREGKKQIIIMTLLCFGTTRQTPILIFRRVRSQTNEPHCAGKLMRGYGVKSVNCLL